MDSDLLVLQIQQLHSDALRISGQLSVLLLRLEAIEATARDYAAEVRRVTS